jgi:cysteine synthase
VDVFVSAVGTGGTITGVGEVLKARNPAVRVVAVEPAGAAVLSDGPAGKHQMPGIGVGFIPEVLNRAIVDEVVAVTDDEAFEMARRLARGEGILAGASSGHYCSLLKLPPLLRQMQQVILACAQEGCGLSATPLLSWYFFSVRFLEYWCSALIRSVQYSSPADRHFVTLRGRSGS